MMIRIYNQPNRAQQWLRQFQAKPPLFACVLGFTETGLIPGISAAGATPADRQFTALADAEFLYHGPQLQAKYPLPPLQAGASPVLITRAVVTAQQIPVYLFDAGLAHSSPVPVISLGGTPARCLSQANALDLATVKHLFQQGLCWGEKLAAQNPDGYVILSECVVGGTTTALAILAGLGIDAIGKVNSSHPTCNHQQKWNIVQQGLKRFAAQQGKCTEANASLGQAIPKLAGSPFELVAAVGDPMQIVVAGMAIAASRVCGVLLAGGTQMLAVYALAEAIVSEATVTEASVTGQLPWRPEQILVGTTRWVAEDLTGDTVGLAELIGVPLLATQLSFANSRFAALRAYEQGYVKEGVGAGGIAIAAHLYQGWNQTQLLDKIESLAAQSEKFRQNKIS